MIPGVERRSFRPWGRVLLGSLAGLFIVSNVLADLPLTMESSSSLGRQEVLPVEPGSGSANLEVRKLLARAQTELNAIRQVVHNAQRIRDERESLLKMLEPLDLEWQIQETARWNRPSGQRQAWAVWGGLTVFGGVLLGFLWARR